MTTGQFLAFLRTANIHPGLDEDGDLTIEAPREVLTPDIVQQVRSRKKELIEYMRSVMHRDGSLSRIPKAATLESYPLSSSQLRIWLACQLDVRSTVYNIPNVMEWKGELDLAHFESAISAVVERHEILRTVFRADENGAVRQWILPPVPLNGLHLPYIDVSAADNATEKAKGIIREDMDLAFNLEEGPLWRLLLFRLGARQFLVYYNMHHTISDGWSMNILYRDLLRFYEAFRSGSQPHLPGLDIQYKDYAVWEEQLLQTGQLAVHRDYWIDRLSGELPVLELPMAKRRSPSSPQQGHVLLMIVSKEDTEAMRAFCGRRHCSLFMGLIGVLITLLYRYTGQEDIVIGTPVAGRDHMQVEDQIGTYINTLALRIRFHGEDSFAQLLEEIRTVTLSAYEHQVYPFDHLHRELDGRGAVNRPPLFSTFIALQNQQESMPGREQPQTGAGIIDEGAENVKFDLPFNFHEVDGSLHMRLGFNTDIYDRESIVRLMKHYQNLFRLLPEQPGDAIALVDYLSPEEKLDVLLHFNDTACDYPRDKTIVSLFMEQSVRIPDEPAIVFQRDRISYAELDERSTQLAFYLRDSGVGEGSLVPVCMQRCPEMIVAFLGILKAGAAYIPIDPGYPPERITYMITEAQAPLVITVAAYRRLPEEQPGIPVLYLDEEEIPAALVRAGEVPVIPKPDSPAYVIFTSGSTGRPKGVMIEHTSVVNLIWWHMQRYEVPVGCRSTAMAGVGFDAYALEIWSALLSGSCLYIVTDEVKLDSGRLLDLYEEDRITHAFVPPALVPGVVAASRGRNLSLRYVLIGGERLQPVDITGLTYTLVNQYGPTEATVMVTDYPIVENGQSSYPIGKPIANSYLYLLDGHLNPVPVGVPGEIYIGGVQLAKGYINNPMLTIDRFIPDPFSGRPDARLYRTGDLAKWLPDGNMEYIGRSDQQVKILGYRIELSEIEHALTGISGITTAVVRTFPGAGGKDILVAYFLGRMQSGSAIRSQLQKTLPDYMIPRRFIHLQRLPLTPNGKVDLKTLPAPEMTDLRRETPYIAPRDAIDSRLVALAAGVLNKTAAEIGIEDNFFDLGANSLTLVKMTALLNKEFNTSLKVVTLFGHPTIRSLADACFRESPASAQADREVNSTASLNDILELFAQ